MSSTALNARELSSNGVGLESWQLEDARRHSDEKRVGARIWTGTSLAVLLHPCYVSEVVEHLFRRHDSASQPVSDQVKFTCMVAGLVAVVEEQRRPRSGDGC